MENKNSEKPVEIPKGKRMLVQAIAGSLSACTLHILHPFDLIKVRFQSHDSGKKEMNVIPRYKSIWDSIQTISREEGIRGLYKGVFVTIAASSVSYGVFFAIYEMFKQQYRPYLSNALALDVLSSSSAAALSSLLVQPFFVLKTRRVLDQKEGLGARRTAALAKELYAQHGLRGFYRGFPLSVALGLHGVVQVSSYNYLKELAIRISEDKENTGKVTFAIGMCSRFLASIFLYPLTTVRTRFQQNQYVEGLQGQKYKSIRDVASKTWSQEGMRGFYKGMVPMLIRTMPIQGVFFNVYEMSKKFACFVVGIEGFK